MRRHVLDFRELTPRTEADTTERNAAQINPRVSRLRYLRSLKSITVGSHSILAFKLDMATTASSLFTRHKPAFFVLASQIFAAILHTLAQVLETGSEPTHPSVILLIRLSVTALFCTLHLWRENAKDFPLGPREVRPLLILRAVGGVSGATGFYCR